MRRLPPLSGASTDLEFRDLPPGVLNPTTVVIDQLCVSLSQGKNSSIPAYIRDEFGYVVNKDALFPGDLILMSPARAAARDFFSRQTIKAQSQRYLNSMWTHAAVYYHDWIIIEATPESNVARNVLFDATHQQYLMVRRGRYITDLLQNDPNAAKIVGLTIALEAAINLGRSTYGLAQACKIWLRERIGLNMRTGDEMSASSIICSGLYAKAYHIATGRMVTNAQMLRNEEAITPALLANCEELETVDVGYARIVP